MHKPFFEGKNSLDDVLLLAAEEKQYRARLEQVLAAKKCLPLRQHSEGRVTRVWRAASF